jgi:hypothetical protein
MERMFEEREAVRRCFSDRVEIEESGIRKPLDPLRTVLRASGMVSARAPDEEIRTNVSEIEIIGDAMGVEDIVGGMHAGYGLAMKY